MDRRMAGIKKYVKLMGNVICALSILFVLAALVRTDFDFTQVTDWRLFLLACAAGIVLKTITVFLSGTAWCLWLEFFAQKRCSHREALRVYAKANIGKYLPGNVMHYVERNLFAGKLKLSQKQIAAASISEILSLVLAAFCMGACMAFSQMREVLLLVINKIPYVRLLSEGRPSVHFSADSSIFRIGAAAAVLSAVVTAACAAGVYYRKRKNAHDPTVKKKNLRLHDFMKTFLISFAIYAAVLVILGLILVFIYWYLGKRPTIRQSLQMIAAYIIAWVLGFVIPGAPGGIGVREMALTLLLSPVMGRDRIVVLGVLHRLITVIGDFTAYLLRGKIVGAK